MPPWLVVVGAEVVVAADEEDGVVEVASEILAVINRSIHSC